MPTTHDLYVKITAGGDPDQKSRELTLEVLKYVSANMPVIEKMGIAVQIHRVRAQDLQNARLVSAMQKRGIDRLPALVTPNNVYIGFGEISGAYTRSIGEYRAYAQSAARSRAAVAPSLETDDLTSFYENEMSLAENDDEDDEAIGKNDMMTKYRGAASDRKPAKGAPPADRKPARAAPRKDNIGQRGPPPRKDNVSQQRGPPPRSQPAYSQPPPRSQPAYSQPQHSDEENDLPDDQDNDEIQGTIDRLSRDIDSSLRAKAFSTTNDEDGENAQDDLMEQAFYANVSSSDMD